MVAPAVTPAPLTGMSVNGGSGVGGSPHSSLSASAVNSIRMSAVMDCLSSHFQGNRKSDILEFLNLCLSLARSIDFSIGNNEVPNRSQELPSLVKQVCKINNNTLLQASVMVLMISVKNACQTGWFSGGDSEELSNLAKEVGTNFCTVPNLSTEPICSHSVISTVMSRFYPRMKMGHIFAYLEVKPGYDAYVSDFQISKNMSSPEDKIRLFVVQTDNIETSSCLVTPAKVNILLNGKGVERRTNIFVDAGPQVPTIVNNLLKYGTNLIQAIGDFNGNYYIAVALMSEVPNPDCNALQDYEQHALTNVEPDSEIIVGSRVSLNCPISIKKIITPVKGRSCKHNQCFDFDNYVDINSRRPSWRCPHCNQHVCFTDIRIDQTMVKILKETGPTISSVLLSADGSWDAIMDSNETVQNPDDTMLHTACDESTQPVDLLDLTVTNDVTLPETEDRKHLWNMTQTNSHNDSWSTMFLSTFGVGSSSSVRQATSSTPVLTDSFTPPARDNTLDTVYVSQSGTPFPSMGNSSVSNEYGRLPSLPKNVTRTPQVLSAQAPTAHLQRSYTNSASTVASTVAMSSHVHPRQSPPVSSSPMIQHSTVQQNTTYTSAGPPGIQAPSTFRVPNAPQGTNQSHLMQSSPSSSSSSLLIPPQSSQQSQLIAAANQAVQMSFEPTRTISSFTNMTSPREQSSNSVNISNPTAELNWQPAGRMRGALSGQAYTEAYNKVMNRVNSANQSLSGQDYPGAYNKVMNRVNSNNDNNQQAQAARPIPNMTGGGGGQGMRADTVSRCTDPELPVQGTG